MKPIPCNTGLLACLVLLNFVLPVSAQDTGLLLSTPRGALGVGDGLTVRASLQAAVNVTPRIEFSSSDSNIATVSSDGAVSGLFPGLVTIRAHELTTGSKSEVELKVIPSRIVISPAELNLRVGESTRLSAQALDAHGNPIPGVSFRFVSGQPQVVAVSSEGMVEAAAEGVITVTAQIDSAPASFGFYSSVALRISPRRQYALRRALISDPGPGTPTISSLTSLSSSGDLLGGIASLSNGGQAAVIRDSSGQLRTVVYAGQFLSNINRLATRIQNISINARGDMLASVQYPDPWCTYGLLLFPRSGPETELVVTCNPFVSRHAMADDGSAFFLNGNFFRRMPDGSIVTVLAVGQDSGPNGLRNINDFWPLRNSSAVLVRATTNNGRPVTLWVTDKTYKIIFSSGDAVGSRAITNHDEMHPSADGSFYGRCNGQNTSMICRATADGFRAMLTNNNEDIGNNVRIGWIHMVHDVSNGKVLFNGDWSIGDQYGPRAAVLEGSTVTLLASFPSWNGVAYGQLTANGTILARVADSDQVLSTLRAGSDPTPAIAKGTPFPTAVPALPDIAFQSRIANGSSLLALGAGEQVVALDSGGVRELISHQTALPDGGRILDMGGLAVNRSGQAALLVNATGGGRLYKFVDGRLVTLLSPNGGVRGSDSNQFSWLWWGRGSPLAINAAGDVACIASFGNGPERLTFIPNGATQAKTIFTFRQPMNGLTLTNLYGVAIDDLGRVLFVSDHLNGFTRALFYWDGQQVREVMRAGATIVGGAKGFTVLINNTLYAFEGAELTMLARGDQPLPGFSRSWYGLSGAISVAGNGDIHVYAGSPDGAGVFVLRPDGTSASILRTGDTLPDGSLVLQPVGIFAGPAGDAWIGVHVLDNGKEKVAIYQASPLR